MARNDTTAEPVEAYEEDPYEPPLITAERGTPEWYKQRSQRASAIFCRNQRERKIVALLEGAPPLSPATKAKVAAALGFDTGKQRR